MLPVYVASVLVLIGYFTVGQFSGSALTASVRAALADPLGGAAIDRVTRYWTPFQRNTQLIPLQGILLANRALWLGHRRDFPAGGLCQVRVRVSRGEKQGAE